MEQKYFNYPKIMFIAPVFSYTAHDNVIYPVSEESTYVPYEAVSDNEFFCC